MALGELAARGVAGQDLSLQSASRHKIQGDLDTEEAENSRAAKRMAQGSRKTRNFLARRSALSRL